MVIFKQLLKSYRFWLAVMFTMPLVVWAWFDKGLWIGDPVSYATQSIMLSKYLLTSKWAWLTQMTYGYKAPLITWIGQVFVFCGIAISHVDFALLFIQCLSYAVTVYWMNSALKFFFASWLVAFVGTLIVSGSPLVLGLASGFWIEPMQVAIVTWFVYAISKVNRWSFYSGLAFLAISCCIALLTKVSSPLYIVIPATYLFVKLIQNKLLQPFERRDIFPVVAAVLLLTATAIFFIYNFERLLIFARFANSSPLFSSEESRQRLLVLFVENGVFAGLDFLVVAAIALFSLLIYYRFNSGKYIGIMLTISLLQIGIFAVAWQKSANVDVRYFAPAVPYFALLIAVFLAIINRPSFTFFVAIFFAVQYISGLAFLFGKKQAIPVYGMIRPISFNGDEKKQTTLDLRMFVTADSKVVFDIGPDLGVAEIQYEIAKQRPTSNWQIACVDVSYFMNYHLQVIDTSSLNIDTIWSKFLICKPEYYITFLSRFDNEKISAERNRIDRYSAVTIPQRWALAQRIQQSGLYYSIPFETHPELVIFKQK